MDVLGRTKDYYIQQRKELDLKIAGLEEQVRSRDHEIAGLEEQVRSRDLKIAGLEEQVRSRDHHIRILEGADDSVAIGQKRCKISQNIRDDQFDW